MIRVFAKRRRLLAGTLCLSAAERSYPTSEVRGRGLECQAATAQERPRGATQRPRLGRPGGATPRPRPGAVTLRSHPKPEARGGSWEEPPAPEARACGREEQPEEKGKIKAS